MTDHATYRVRLPLGSAGCAWRSVAGSPGAFATRTANAAGTGAGDAAGISTSVPTDDASVSIAA